MNRSFGPLVRLSMRWSMTGRTVGPFRASRQVSRRPEAEACRLSWFMYPRLDTSAESRY
jgi:hypothetical protein